MKTANPYVGRNGDYFVKHRKTGERIVCVWAEHREGNHYHEPEYTADTTIKKHAEMRDWLLCHDVVMLTVSETDAAGNPTWRRKDYIDLYRIANCRVEADGLHFDFVERLSTF